MSDWDLMMPGMGLTAIGLSGVVLSYSGIAHTFIDGMHALTGLTMFIGLIFLASGILSGGVSTSNKAKATTLVIFGIAGSFGAFAFTFSNISTLPVFAGLLLVIIVPSIMIAYASMKFPQYAKPISAIFVIAAGAAVASFVGFGLTGQEQPLLPQPEQGEEQPQVEEGAAVPPEGEEEVVAEADVTVAIPEGAQTEGNPDYVPDKATVTKGDVVEWVNEDTAIHTVTSSEDQGETFDSSVISAGESYRLDTTDIKVGDYEYYCTVHPFMIGTLSVQGSQEEQTTAQPSDVPEEQVGQEKTVGEQGKSEKNRVSIPEGAQTQSVDQIYYDPAELSVSVGTTVVWVNEDTAVHTVTSRNAEGPYGDIDSGLFSSGEEFEYTFESEGEFEYYCMVHPWMEGLVKVNKP